MALSLPSPSSLLKFSKIVEGEVVKTLENYLRLQAKVHIQLLFFIYIFFCNREQNLVNYQEINVRLVMVFLIFVT